METIQYHRRPDLPGIELRSVRDSARCFRHYSTGFEFLAPSTWRGEVWHRRRREILQPGWVLSSHPGDVFVGEHVLQGGSWSSLTIDPDALASLVAEPAAWSRLQLRPFAELSELLATRLFRVCQDLRAGAELAEVRAGLRAFLEVASRELRDQRGVAPHGAAAGLPSRAAERFACFRRGTADRVPLADLTTETGLSRFQALRAFKRHFGLTPHTYQLRVRLGLAQKSLRAGARPADVAMDFGFVDQSHLTRHFKRFVGVTPAEYARSTT
jgi:AraC-like DNA-binding protein